MWPLRGASILSVRVQVSRAGSKTSAVLLGIAPPPPTTTTLPSVSSVAVCPPLERLMDAPGVHVWATGSNVSVDS